MVMTILLVYGLGIIVTGIVLALYFRHDKNCEWARGDIALIASLALVWPVLVLHVMILGFDWLSLEMARYKWTRGRKGQK